MACMLWSDDAESGCLEFDTSEQMVGRSCITESPRWLPRNIFEVFEAKGFWLIRLVTSHDWIIVEYHDETRWIALKPEPNMIDENTMIRVRMLRSNYVFKLVFMGHLLCKDVTSIGYIWQSNVWTSSTSKPAESTSVSESKVEVPDRDQLMQGRLEWLARYFEKHPWSSILSLLTVGIVIVGGYWIAYGSLPNGSPSNRLPSYSDIQK